MMQGSNEFTDSQINFYLGMAFKIMPSIVNTTDVENLKYLEAMFAAYYLIYNKPEVRGATSTGSASTLGNNIRIGRIQIDNSKTISNKIRDMILLANYYYDQFKLYADTVSLEGDIANEMNVTIPSDYTDLTYDSKNVDGKHYDDSTNLTNPDTEIVYNADGRYV